MHKYKRERVLGKGGFGEAILASSREDRSRKFVVKEVNLSSLSVKEQEDARKEAAFLKELQHQNIIRCVQQVCDCVVAVDRPPCSHSDCCWWGRKPYVWTVTTKASWIGHPESYGAFPYLRTGPSLCCRAW